MKDSIQDKELKQLFEAHKKHIPNDGFSQRVMQTLPDRVYISRPILLLMGFVILLAFVFFIDNGTIVGAIADLIVSVCTLKTPSLISITIYAGLIAMLSFLGFTAYKAT